MSDRLTLISPFEPDSRWFAHAAMERNKLLYGLSDAALVVASAAETGGTWAGATEALKRGRVKVFVKDTGTAAPGNAKLLRRGGVAFPPEPWENLRELLTPPEDNNRQLFSEAEEKPAARTDPDAGRETTAHVTSSQHSPCDEGRLERAPEEEKSIRDAYALVIDRMLALLEEPRTTEWVAGEMDVRSAQMKIWLERAAREGRIRKLRKPVRYVANSPGLFRG